MAGKLQQPGGQPMSLGMDSLPPISVVDIGASLVICLSALRGFLRGLSGEISQLISLAASLILGIFFREPFGRWLMGHTHLAAPTAHALAFTVTVFGALVVLILIGFVLRKIMKVVFEPGVDKPFGGLAGLLSGVLIVIIVFAAMNLWPHEYLNRKFGEESVIGRVIVKWMPKAEETVDEIPIPKDVKREIREATEL